MKSIVQKMLVALTVLTMVAAVSVLTGCERREYHRHEERVQRDVVIQEGPIVE